ncbi:MAG TPA: hypothetical protein VHD83_12770 [Puia sp.]|nr:hypothetical protein [Puia sp.]
MSSDLFLTFQKFNDPALAELIAGQLQDAGIDTLVVKEDALLDPTIIGNDLGSTIHLKIAPSNFDRANVLLENYYQRQIQTMDPDYYLFSFTNDELLEILRKPDEWGHLDHALAKKLLADRGRSVTSAELEGFHQERITELAAPSATHPFLIFLGYLSAFGGGIIGFVLGYILISQKKTLPNGERVFTYPLSEQKHGKRILVISIISFIFWFLVMLTARLAFWEAPL